VIEDPILPIPVSPPSLQEVSPKLCEGRDPGFFCVWLADTSRRAFATEGNKEVEVDYRRHRKWSREAVAEFSEEYTERMPGMMDPSDLQSLDNLMHNICLNLRDEPHRWNWSYLFNAEAGTSYICIKKCGEEFCSEINAGLGTDSDEADFERYEDSEVIGNIREMYFRDQHGPGAI